MTTRHPWHRKNRPQTPRNSLPGRYFQKIASEQKVKKIARRLERSARVPRLIDVGAVIPPHRLYSARAPIHPKRPYGLTRPVVPPDGSFISAHVFWNKLLYAPRRTARRPVDFPFVGVTRDISRCLPEPNDRGALRNAAILPCSLTVKGDDGSVFVRGFSIAARSVAPRTRQRESFPQNIDVTPN
jgi:hypothetical protein